MQQSKASSRFGWVGLGKWHMAPGLPLDFFIISFLPEYLKPPVAGDPLAQQGHRVGCSGAHPGCGSLCRAAAGAVSIPGC